MGNLNDILNQIDAAIGGSDWFVYLLLGTGLFFTIYLKFPQIRYFRMALRVVRGKYDRDTDVGDASHFQALATALSGTVGTGNIGGVAFAIHLGGPAALFWMLVTAFLGMTTKFVEVTLSHKYREEAEDGSIAGGPMYYMKNKLNLKWLAAIFAVATIMSSFGTGNMPQINNIADTMRATFEVPELWTGIVLSVLLALVILGGIKRIVKVTEKLVPTMAVIYFIGALAVIFYNAGNIVPSFAAVFSDIFTGSAALGGFIGANFAFAFNRGVNRGLFSNEAGQGSAPIAHAAAKAHEPVSEGLVAILEPFIDTIIICTLTGLVLLSSGVWTEKFQNDFEMSDLKVISGSYSDQNDQDREKIYSYLVEMNNDAVELYTGELDVVDGQIQNDVTLIHARSVAESVEVLDRDAAYTGKLTVRNGDLNPGSLTIRGKSLIHSAALTTKAFTRGFFGDYGKYIVSIGLLLFAFSTAISWSYYGDRATTYLFGSNYVNYYRVVYIAGFFLAAISDTSMVWTIANITIAIMTIPNLIGILLLRKDMKSTVSEFWKNFKEEYPDEKAPKG